MDIPLLKFFGNGADSPSRQAASQGGKCQLRIIALSYHFRAQRAIPTPSTPQRLLLLHPHSVAARRPKRHVDAAAETAAALCAALPCRCRELRAPAAARPGTRGLRIFPPPELHHPRFARSR